MKENLNIAWWHERMILMALAKYHTQKAAARALGVSERTLIRMKNDLYENKLQIQERRNEKKQRSSQTR